MHGFSALIFFALEPEVSKNSSAARGIFPSNNSKKEALDGEKC
jgi:hypothetical protein